MNPSEIDRSDWTEPLPRRLARPTYWPSMLALSVTLALLGPVTSMAITGVGVLLAAAALSGWIGEIGRE
ncbi:MAG TPA: hypothetical protein VMB85_20455 [Bryobacteraceae bacterium]|jgi:hypothetical protein|nr:hypothetical protein [Bryobacteraceae bacterium]